MELGKVERNQYGDEYVYIDFYGRTFKFRVDDAYEETEEIDQINQNEKELNANLKDESNNYYEK